MPLLSRKEANKRYQEAEAALGVAKMDFESSGSPSLGNAQQHQTVVDWLAATENRILSDQRYLREKVHASKALLDTETEELAKMLTELTDAFFPEPDVTLVDNDQSLEAQVMQMDPDSTALMNFRAALGAAKDEATILAEWYDWSGGQAIHDAGGMFTAIRQKHKLTKRLATRIDDVARAFRRLRAEGTRGTRPGGNV
jgi:hypothetical protein